MVKQTVHEHFASIIKNGVARSNRYQVLIPLPNFMNGNTKKKQEQSSTWTVYGVDVFKSLGKILGASSGELTRGLDLTCEQTEIPGKSFTTSDIKYNADFYRLPSSVVYGLQPFTFRSSRDMLEKDVIDTWMNGIVDIQTQAMMYYEDFTVDITINQLDINDNVVYSVVLKDAYPSYCNPITLSASETNMVSLMMVQFSYRKWYRVGKNEEGQQKGLGRISETPFGSILTPIMSNPVVSEAMSVMKDKGINLEGDAMDIYNMADKIVKNTTGSSINKSTSLLTSMVGQVKLNKNITSAQSARLIQQINLAVSKLNGKG